jgi:hypothetical protein
MISCVQTIKQEKWTHIVISPLDGSQEVTVITKGNKRYVMNGRHENIPEDNYLLLDLSKVDRLGDGFSICWDDNGYRWKLASSYAKLVENKLDTSKYTYYQPLDKSDKPLSVDYKNINCGNFLIREEESLWGNLKVRYIGD